MNTLEAYEERVLNRAPEKRRKAVRDCKLFIRIAVALLVGILAFALVYAFIPAVAYGESLSMKCFIAALTFAIVLDLLHHELRH